VQSMQTNAKRASQCKACKPLIVRRPEPRTFNRVRVDYPAGNCNSKEIYNQNSSNSVEAILSCIQAPTFINFPIALLKQNTHVT
jgi:hypothetical protein